MKIETKKIGLPKKRWEAKVVVSEYSWCVGYGWTEKRAKKDLKRVLGVKKTKTDKNKQENSPAVAP